MCVPASSELLSEPNGVERSENAPSCYRKGINPRSRGRSVARMRLNLFSSVLLWNSQRLQNGSYLIELIRRAKAHGLQAKGVEIQRASCENIREN